jgi:hypothetical protein
VGIDRPAGVVADRAARVEARPAGMAIGFGVSPCRIREFGNRLAVELPSRTAPQASQA